MVPFCRSGLNRPWHPIAFRLTERMPRGHKLCLPRLGETALWVSGAHLWGRPEHGGRLSYGYLSRMVHRYALRAGLEPFGMHMLRHAWYQIVNSSFQKQIYKRSRRRACGKCGQLCCPSPVGNSKSFPSGRHFPQALSASGRRQVSWCCPQVFQVLASRGGVDRPWFPSPHLVS